MDSAGIRTAVLRADLQKLRQTPASDKELAGYADMFLWRNAESLFDAGKKHYHLIAICHYHSIHHISRRDGCCR